MQLASTKSVASSFFSSAAEEASDASSAAKPAKSDADDSPDFLAILALLFPVSPIAPTAPTVTNESTSGTGAAIIADGTVSAAGMPGANSTNTATDANTSVLLIGKQELPKPAIGTTTSTEPNAEMAGEIWDATAKQGSGVAPNGESPAVTSAVASVVTQDVAATTANRPNDAAGRSNFAPSKPLQDPKAIAKDDAAEATQEKPAAHASESTLPLVGMKNVPIPSTMDAGFVIEKPKTVSVAKEDGLTRSNTPAPAHSYIGTDPLAARAVEAKPATSFVDQVHSAFEANLDQLREHGRVELHMDLHPPDLGRMRLHLSMEDNQVHVRMDVHDERAKQVLEQQMQPLRVHFAEMGVSLGQLDVRRDGTGNAPQQDQYAPTQPPSGTQSRPEAARLRGVYERDSNSDSLVDVLA